MSAPRIYDLPEREKYPLWLTTPQVHEMLGGAVGMKRLRALAKELPDTLMIAKRGRALIWNRDAVLRWALTVRNVGWGYSSRGRARRRNVVQPRAS